MENWDISEILNHGFKGLGFLLAFLLIRMIYKEQMQDQPRKRIITFGYVFMLFSLIIIGLGFIIEYRNTRIFNYSNENSLNESRLILIGSGTVCRYLKNKKEKIIEDLNVDMFSGPSLTSIQLLANRGIEGYGGSDFIALSSSRFNEKELLTKESWKALKKESQYKKIVALRIDTNNLQLGIRSKDLFFFKEISNNSIRDSILFSLVKDLKSNEYAIYCTSIKSGTVKEYYKLFRSIETDFTWPNQIKFNASSANQDAILTNEELPFIFLGSKIYFLEGTEPVEIITQDGQNISTELLMYFIVTEKEFNNGFYEIGGLRGKFIMELKRLVDQNTGDGDVYKLKNVTGKNLLEVNLK